MWSRCCCCWCSTVSQETLQFASWAWGTGQVKFLSDTHCNDFQHRDQWRMMGFSYMEGELKFYYFFLKQGWHSQFVIIMLHVVQTDGTFTRENWWFCSVVGRMVSKACWSSSGGLWWPNILTHIITWLYVDCSCTGSAEGLSRILLMLLQFRKRVMSGA